MLMPCISDVWSPSEDQRPKVASKATQSMKDRFLSHLKEKNLLTIRARRASAESLSSNLVSPKGNLLRGVDKKPFEDREFQFVYIYSLLHKTQFIRGQNGSKLQFLS